MHTGGLPIMSDESKETDINPVAYKIEPVEYVEVMDEFRETS